jgi:hypothetical protein
MTLVVNFMILKKRLFVSSVLKGLQNLGQARAFEQRDLSPATPAVTSGLEYTALIQRTTPFSRLLQHTSGC